MNKLYRFSPIDNEKAVKEAYAYITTELEKLSQKIFNESLPINTLKIFPHYLDEYDYLLDYVNKLGSMGPFNSKTSTYSVVDEKIKGYGIKYLGVRIVDPYRLHVGCGDYEIENFEEFKAKYSNTSPYIRDLEDHGMLEIWHPDFDVLGYVVPQI